jgi:hypothetical protein
MLGDLAIEDLSSGSVPQAKFSRSSSGSNSMAKGGFKRSEVALGAAERPAATRALALQASDCVCNSTLILRRFSGATEFGKNAAPSALFERLTHGLRISTT